MIYDYFFNSYILVPGLFTWDDNVFKLNDYFNSTYNHNFCNGVYGGINCYWHSGRLLDNELFNIPDEDITSKCEDIFKQYKEKNIAIHMVFSAYDVDKETIDDKRSNLLLDVLAKTNNPDNPNYCIVSSDILRDYIREKYPELKITCSVIKTCLENKTKLEEPEWYNKLCEEDWDTIVPRQDWNCHLDYLYQIKNKDKLELVADEECTYMCPMRGLHYQLTHDVLRNKPDALKKLYGLYDICARRKLEHPLITKTKLDNFYMIGIKKFKFTHRENIYKDWLYNTYRYIFSSFDDLEYITKL